MPRPRPVLVAVVGPTGAGKSDLALELALRFGGEVVSCDALQVYRELDIGTAKLTEDDRRGVPHHLLDVVPPVDSFSAARYLELASARIRDIVGRGRLPLVVGGTGLYLRALRFGLFEGPGSAPELRERLRALATRRPPGSLHRILRRWDPASAERIHPNDSVRLVRALEVTLVSGRPMSALMGERQAPLPEFRDILVGLAPSREELARRVASRVQWMFDHGLMEEVADLMKRYGNELPAFKAIGYRECVRALAGETEPSAAREETVRASLAYAKRQMTWFRREEGVRWFHGCGDDASLREEVIATLDRELAVTERGFEHGRAPNERIGTLRERGTRLRQGFVETAPKPRGRRRKPGPLGP